VSIASPPPGVTGTDESRRATQTNSAETEGRVIRQRQRVSSEHPVVDGVVADRHMPRRMLVAYRRLAILLDFACGAAGAGIASMVRFGPHPAPQYVIFTALVPVAWVLTIAAHRGYEFRFLGTGNDEYRRIADAGLMLFIAIAVISFVLRGDIARGYVVLAVPAGVALTLLTRHRQRKWLFSQRMHGRGMQRVLVVGRADTALTLIEKLDHEPQHGLLPVGACVDWVSMEVSHLADVPVVGDPTEVLSAVELTGADVVAVASHPDLSGQALRRLSWQLEDAGVELVVSPGIVEVAGPRLSIRPVAGLSLLHLESPSLSGGRVLLKSVVDRCGALLLLTAFSPLVVVVMLLVRLSSPGPVFFKQQRVGADGSAFWMLKFRSMVQDAEQVRSELEVRHDGNEMLFKLRHDPRVTRVGGWLRRFSLDELPQLINVARGEMSLVGPRPPLPGEVAEYSADAIRRLRVRPGMTGLWQVSGRSDLSWEESLRLDLRYVDNWSLSMDLLILWRTCRAVLNGSGAY
jgi:exopolysaccharide biosynthesis polyprenyl glycosylphosphotransferase